MADSPDVNESRAVGRKDAAGKRASPTIVVCVNGEEFTSSWADRTLFSWHFKQLLSDSMTDRQLASARGLPVFHPPPPILVNIITYRPMSHEDEDEERQKRYAWRPGSSDGNFWGGPSMSSGISSSGGGSEAKQDGASSTGGGDADDPELLDSTRPLKFDMAARAQRRWKLFNEYVFEAMVRSNASRFDGLVSFEELACYALALLQGAVPFDATAWLHQIQDVPTWPHHLFRACQLIHFFSSTKYNNVSSGLDQVAKSVIAQGVQTLGARFELLKQLVRVFTYSSRLYSRYFNVLVAAVAKLYPGLSMVEERVHRICASVVKRLHRLRGASASAAIDSGGGSGGSGGMGNSAALSPEDAGSPSANVASPLENDNSDLSPEVYYSTKFLQLEFEKTAPVGLVASHYASPPSAGRSGLLLGPSSSKNDQNHSGSAGLLLPGAAKPSSRPPGVPVNQRLPGPGGILAQSTGTANMQVRGPRQAGNHNTGVAASAPAAANNPRHSRSTPM